MNRIFHDRTDAGRILAARLTHFARRPEVLVLALPRGGVPVGFEVAQKIGVPLDVLVVRKLGVPGNLELAMGAIASGGALYRNEPVIAAWSVTPREFKRAVERETAELARREAAYRGERPPAEVAGRMVILVDDGIATGSTMRAAIHALASRRPAGIVVAAPVIAAQTVAELAPWVNEVVTALAPDELMAIGQFYADFRQTTDDEVRALLARAKTCGKTGKICREAGGPAWEGLAGPNRPNSPS
jgi:putative phosphoribosyl transferase